MINQPKVLVIDRDKNILSVFNDFLYKENCNLIAATCVDEAIINFKLQQIDLLIIDIDKNNHTDLVMINIMKQIQKNLPVIIITSYTDLIEETEAKRYGANYFLPKPLNLEDLRIAVRNCLQRKNFVN
jgi:DNA-binding NtrC family response regulator